MQKHPKIWRRQGFRGATLALTLAVISLALILGLTLSGSSLVHLHQSTQSINRLRAANAAEAALADVSERLLREPEFGIGRMPDHSVEVEFEQSVARVTFHEQTASAQGIPLSTSNRFGIEPIEGWDSSVVPHHSVQVYAVGESGGVQVFLESVISVPEFPYVVASSGPVQSSGALTVGVVEAFEDILIPEALRPAALAANGKVNITGQANIIGSLESTSSIVLGDSVNVRGEVRPLSEAVTLDDLDVASLRPTASVPLPGPDSPRIAGRYHHNGPELNITGGLELDDGVLYVNGDTHVSGGIQGKGAIVVNGDLTIEGSSSLAAETQIALVSQGDLTISGRGPESSFFQGLIYTEGDFLAQDVTLVGAFVANRKPVSSTNPGSRMELHNTRVVSFPEYGTFDLEGVPFTVWGESSKESQGGRETLTLFEVDEQDLPALENAVTLTHTGGVDGGASQNDGTSHEDTRYVYTPSHDLGAAMAVTRARRVIVQDGKLVSEWTELSPGEVGQFLARLQGPEEPFESRELLTDLTMPAALVGFRADPSSLFWEEIRGSLHLDFNEFLGRDSRVRVTSWRELR